MNTQFKTFAINTFNSDEMASIVSLELMISQRLEISEIKLEDLSDMDTTTFDF